MLGEGRALVNPLNDAILGSAMVSRPRCVSGRLVVGVLVVGSAGQGPTHIVACLETRGYTLTK